MTAATASDISHNSLARRHIFAATVGNALEFYDFITYGFFAIQIGHSFFPNQGAFGSLMLSLATFGAGFVTRPIGGIVIGAYADRVGRKAAMLVNIFVMGIAIILLAIIPPYAAIGIAAPVLAVAARMAQGFALGGEVGPNTAYLLEAAAPDRRGLIVAWQGASQQVASIVGGLVGLGLATVMDHAALESYGWRIAFLLGAAILPVGLWLRRSMPETLGRPEPPAAAPAPATGRAARLPANARVLVLAVMLFGSGTIGTYIINYMTTFAQSTLHMPARIAFAAALVPNVAVFVGVLFGGWLSDRVGRRPVMIWPKLLSTVLIIPLFRWIVASHGAAALLGGTAVVAFAGAMASGAFYPALCESFPKRVRSQAYGASYAVGIAVFGGTTQPVVAWLIHVTGNPMAPGWYWLAASLVSLPAMVLMIESAPVRVGPGLVARPA